MIDEEPEVTSLPSKSQLKREAHAQQELGKRLTEVAEKTLDKLPLSEAIRNAIAEYNRLPNSHGARRRQLQYLGKLMRDVDYQEISDALEQLTNNFGGAMNSTSESNGSLTSVWLQRIVDEGESAIDALVNECPTANRQQLRQLYRNIASATDAKQERQKNKLQRYLDELDRPG